MLATCNMTTYITAMAMDWPDQEGPQLSTATVAVSQLYCSSIALFSQGSAVLKANHKAGLSENVTHMAAHKNPPLWP